LGSYTVEASATNYTTASQSALLDVEDAVVTKNFALTTPHPNISPTSFTFLLAANGGLSTRSANLNLTNDGSADMNWTLVESASWLSPNPTSGMLTPGSSQTIVVTASKNGLMPGVYDTTMLLNSNSGRLPSIFIPVRLILSAYQQGVNSGGPIYIDLQGDTWAADQAYSIGNWGYANQSAMISTKKLIDGTSEDPLYQNGRRLQVEYRFDGLP